MSHRTGTMYHTWKERALSLLLAAVLLIGLAPGLALPASAEHWADAYLDQLVDWGVIRADQTANPDAPLTRAEFMGIINRAYGYAEVGPIPFTDVMTTDWFYDDVRIAYTAGYMAGTSATTAEPNATLTREQAVCILGRNMMLKETPGESLAFADSRDVSDWARGTIKTAVDNYIVSGHPDNTFRPLDPVSKAQMAVLVTQCIGTPISQSGTHELGGVFGNVTITSPNVTLRNTTISGDLYISGGVGLGGIKLENVDVLGRIIVSGTGESEGGDASVIMRNVNAREMLVDNMRNKTVTVRADGITEIANTIVRTNAYLEDNNTDEKGLLNIVLDGEPGTHLTLAGRVKNVVNKTPNSTVQVAKGSVAKLTVDEAATNSTVQIDRNTEVKELNLDVGTNVIGEGSIGKLNVNAPGSVVTMLPDKIYIRPGLNATIAGVVMDHTAAEEGSTDPRLLSGYPAAKDIAPTGFRADFSGNKKGTIFWAVSSISDGSIGEEALINPPSYGSKAIQGGSVAAPAGDTVVNAQVTGLTVAGSYYLSALLRDEQGRTSPVKVISFSTPDNTVPAFAQGYPYMSLITDTEAQVTVMPTKDCKMYYAVLPRSAQAPTVNELKSAAVSNNLGYGVVDVYKNKEDPFTVSRRLEELKDYTLYLWLTDVDGVNSSAIVPVQFTTMDVTPPIFVTGPDVNQFLANSVRLTASINEAGTIYWAVVEAGTPYPKPNNQNPDDNTPDQSTALLTSDYAKLQVANGLNALQRGQVTVQANAQATINVNGLQPEKAYDFYYLAKDNAGPNRNYSEEVKMITIYTLDEEPPVVKQYFSDYSGSDNTINPMPSTDIILEFSEAVRSTATAESKSWVELYNSITAENNPLAGVLNASIELYLDTGNGTPQPVKAKYLPNDQGDDWIIDFTQATVEMENGKMLLTFPEEGLKLDSGATYYFKLQDITDTSNGQNRMVPNPLWYNNMAEGGHNIPRFTTVFAQVNLSNPGVGASDAPLRKGKNDNGAKEDPIYVDLSFRMSPHSTEKVQDQNSYDLYLWSDTIVQYDLYYRIVEVDGRNVTPATGTVDKKYLLSSPNNGVIDTKGWVYLGNSGEINPKDGELAGITLNEHFNKLESNTFPPLNCLSEDYSYEFAIELTEMVGKSNRKVWNGQISFDIYVSSGLSATLKTLGTGLNSARWDEYIKDGLNNGGIVSIGLSPQNTDYLRIRQLFTDTQLPVFAENRPEILDTNIGDTFATINLSLDRAGKIYYVVAPIGQLSPRITIGTNSYSDKEAWNQLQGTDGKGGGDQPVGGKPEAMGYTVTSPSKLSVYMRTEYSGNPLIHTGVINYPGGSSNYPLRLQDSLNSALQPETEYCIYFVLQGTAQEYSDVYAYRFKTTDVNRPKITLRQNYSGTVAVTTHVPSDLTYGLITPQRLAQIPEFGYALNGHLSGEFTGLPPNYETYPGETGDMTIIQAMMTPYRHNTALGSGTNTADSTELPVNGSAMDGYSVFDVYADTSIKERMSQIIRNGAQQYNFLVTNNMDPTLEASEPNRFIDERETMVANTIYYCIAVAYHTSSMPITGDSFAAVPSVQLPDDETPELNDAIGGISQKDGKYNGNVTLFFTKDLYWKEKMDSTSVKKVGGTGGVTLLENAGKYVSDGATVTGTGSGTSFNIKFTGIESGDNVELFSNGFICNQSGTGTSKKARITLVDGYIVSPESGAQIRTTYFEIQWDGVVIKQIPYIP